MPAQEAAAEKNGTERRIVAGVDAIAAWHYPVATGGFGYAPMGTGEEFDFNEITQKVLAVSQHCVHHARCPVLVIRGQ